MDRDRKASGYLNILFLLLFGGLIALSVFFSYQRVFVERNYQVLMTAVEVENAGVDLFDTVKQIFNYGTSN